MGTSARRGSVKVALIAAAMVVIAAAVWWLVGRPAGRGPYIQGPAEAPLRDISRVAAAVGPAVVRIDTTVAARPSLLEELFGIPGRRLPLQGQGSGIIINGREGYVLTNAHVVGEAANIGVTLPSGQRFRAKTLGVDEISDLAVLKLERGIRGARRLPQVELGSSDRLAVGSWVVAVGTPIGLQNTVTAGILSAKGRTLARENGPPVIDLLQTDAAINEGNSGGALVDLRGQLVGVPTAIRRGAAGIGFAVAVDTAKSVIPYLVRGEQVQHAWLGVEVSQHPVSREVMIRGVVEGSPAAAAGLRAGDIIVTASGQAVREGDDLVRAIRTRRPGERLALLVRREGETRELEVRLGRLPSGG